MRDIEIIFPYQGQNDFAVYDSHVASDEQPPGQEVREASLSDPVFVAAITILGAVCAAAFLANHRLDRRNKSDETH